MRPEVAANHVDGLPAAGKQGREESGKQTDHKHQGRENGQVFGRELDPDGDVRVVQQTVYHWRPPDGQEDGHGEAHQRKDLGFQDAAAENGSLRCADQPSCSHLPGPFGAEGHVQVDVVEHGADKQEEHGGEEQVQRPLVAVRDIS